MIDVIAWVGAVAFAVCAIPQAWACFKQKHAAGLDWSFLLLWLLGELCFLVYSIHLWDLPLMTNYIANGLSLFVIIYYKLRPASAAEEKRREAYEKFITTALDLAKPEEFLAGRGTAPGSFTWVLNDGTTITSERRAEGTAEAHSVEADLRPECNEGNCDQAVRERQCCVPVHSRSMLCDRGGCI